MRNLVNFIFESNIQELKDLLINNINKLSDEDEKLIRKLTRLSSKAVYENILKWLDYSGLGKLKDTIMAKLEFLDIIEDLENIYSNHFNNDDSGMITFDDIINGTDIYDLILSKTKNTNITKDVLFELSNFQMSIASITKGPFEILMQLFLSDIKKYNIGKADINDKYGEMELKGTGARVMSKTAWARPTMVYDYLKKKIESIPSVLKSSSLPANFNIDAELNKIEKELNNNKKSYNLNIDTNDAFATEKNFITFIENIYNIDDIKSTNLESILNIIILESILMQVKYNGVDIDKFKKQFIETIIDKCPPVENNKANYNNLNKSIFLMQFYAYYTIEKFNKLIVFAKDTKNKGKFTGKYMVIDVSNEHNPFEYLIDLINKNNGLSYAGGFSKLFTKSGNTGTPRDYASMIIYTKK